MVQMLKRRLSTDSGKSILVYAGPKLLELFSLFVLFYANYIQALHIPHVEQCTFNCFYISSASDPLLHLLAVHPSSAVGASGHSSVPTWLNEIPFELLSFFLWSFENSDLSVTHFPSATPIYAADGGTRLCRRLVYHQ